MSVALVTYAGDRRLELGNAEAVRAPVYGSDWNQIRIGLQCSFNGVASAPTGTPRLAMGLCTGNTNVMVDRSSGHVLGIISDLATWTYAAGPPSYVWGAAAIIKSYLRVSTTETIGNFATTNRYFSNATAVRTGLFLDITKGSPNYSVVIGFANSTSSVQSDLNDTEFTAIMELLAMNSTTIAAAKSGYTASTAVTIAVDEGTNGLLDHLFVYWDRTSHLFSFNIRHRKIS